MPNLKDEFYYVSSIFVCGENSTRTQQYKVFNLDIFRKHKDLAVRISKSGNRVDRIIPLTDHSEIATHIQRGSLIGSFAPLVSYVDSDKLINISDTIFNESEFKTHGKNIDALIQRKIHATAKLIEAFYNQDISQVPTLMNDFPNICKLVLGKSAIIFK